MNKLISIIVPVYKVEQYVSRCIDSVLSQSYPDWELILVDDGSPDNSGCICDEYSQKDSRIKVIHTTNQGRSCARNTGLEHSSGEWIAFIDSDDYVGQDYLQCMVNANSEWNPQLLVTQGFHGIYADGGHDMSYSGFNFKDYFFENGSAQDIISSNRLLHFQAVWGRLFYSSLIDEFNIHFPVGIDKCEDGVFLHSYMIHCKYFKFINDRNYYYVTPQKTESCEIKRNYTQNYLLSEIYSKLSVKLIEHFGLQGSNYASSVANMFHYPFSYVVFDNRCPANMRKAAKQLSRDALTYKKVYNYHDVITKIRYILLCLHLY